MMSRIDALVDRIDGRIDSVVETSNKQLNISIDALADKIDSRIDGVVNNWWRIDKMEKRIWSKIVRIFIKIKLINKRKSLRYRYVMEYLGIKIKQQNYF